MDVLFLGGTRHYGIKAVEKLILDGHSVTIATRGLAVDTFGTKVKRITLDRYNPQNIKDCLSGRYFDAVIDNLAYCSDHVRVLLDIFHPNRYILASSAAVYPQKGVLSFEEHFNPTLHPITWGGRSSFSYEEGKRQAEAALFQKYDMVNAIAIRFPVILSADDYTKRLFFYVDRIKRNIPIYVDELHMQHSFIQSCEAGAFVAWILGTDQYGAINSSSTGMISMSEIIQYIESRLGFSAKLDRAGEPAPFNNQFGVQISNDKAQKLGFEFSQLKEWFYTLIDSMMQTIP